MSDAAFWWLEAKANEFVPLEVPLDATLAALAESEAARSVPGAADVGDVYQQ